MMKYRATYSSAFYACPICWRPQCTLFHKAHTRTVTNKPLEDKSVERSNWLRQWHPSDHDICEICKRDRKACVDAKSRHANKVSGIEREIEDGKSFVLELKAACDKAAGEEKGRLQTQVLNAEIKVSRLNRRLEKTKERKPCAHPTKRVLPKWWTANTEEAKPKGRKKAAAV